MNAAAGSPGHGADARGAGAHDRDARHADGSTSDARIPGVRGTDAPAAGARHAPGETARRVPRVAVFVSGGGRSLENLADEVRRGALAIDLALVLSNKAQCGALERAARLEIPSIVVDPARALTPDAFSRDAFTAVESFGCELVVLAGFLRLLVIPERWTGRVLNIHPALLPAFGGHGFYGDKVHAAVLASGVSETGCTVHYVTNEYDAGPIVLQRRVPVLAGDDVHTLAARVFDAEKLALPEAIRRHFEHSGARGGDVDRRGE